MINHKFVSPTLYLGPFAIIVSPFSSSFVGFLEHVGVLYFTFNFLKTKVVSIWSYETYPFHNILFIESWVFFLLDGSMINHGEWLHDAKMGVKHLITSH